MTTLVFTAVIVKKGKGCFVAHAEEFAVAAVTAGTQRGALKKLREAVLLRLREAAHGGTLQTLLGDSGYGPVFIGVHGQVLRAHPLDQISVSLQIGMRLIVEDRAKRPMGGEL